MNPFPPPSADYEYETKHREWSTRLAHAPGPNRGTVKDRDEFAHLLLDQLGWAIVWGTRQQERIKILPRLTSAAVAARDALKVLRAEIAQSIDGRSLHELSASTTVRLAYWGSALHGDEGFDAITHYLETFARLAAAQTTKVRPHRGPRNDLAVIIAATVAWTYHDSFGRWPAIGRRGPNRLTSPFDRICDELQEMLSGLGYRLLIASKRRSYPFTISDPARKKGIDEAKTGRFHPHQSRDDDQWLMRRLFVLETVGYLDDQEPPHPQARPVILVSLGLR